MTGTRRWEWAKARPPSNPRLILGCLGGWREPPPDWGKLQVVDEIGVGKLNVLETRSIWGTCEREGGGSLLRRNRNGREGACLCRWEAAQGLGETQKGLCKETCPGLRPADRWVEEEELAACRTGNRRRSLMKEEISLPSSQEEGLHSLTCSASPLWSDTSSKPCLSCFLSYYPLP